MVKEAVNIKAEEYGKWFRLLAAACATVLIVSISISKSIDANLNSSKCWWKNSELSFHEEKSNRYYRLTTNDLSDHGSAEIKTNERKRRRKRKERRKIEKEQNIEKDRSFVLMVAKPSSTQFKVTGGSAGGDVSVFGRDAPTRLNYFLFPEQFN